jgi:hypothetical protein
VQALWYSEKSGRQKQPMQRQNPENHPKEEIMDYGDEIAQAVADMPREAAEAELISVRESIQKRASTGECACGPQCQNPVGHHAVDRITEIALKKELLKHGVKA